MKPYRPQTIRIKGVELKDGIHNGRAVVYVPRHCKGNLKHPDVENGKVVSWCKRGVMIDYGNKTILTDQRDLFWAL